MNRLNNNLESYIEQIEYYKERLQQYESEVGAFWITKNKDLITKL